MANRYIASVRRIKLITDFGWTEVNRWYKQPGQKIMFELNNHIAYYDYGRWIVEAPNRPIKWFDAIDPFCYQDMTNYAQKKED